MTHATNDSLRILPQDFPRSDSAVNKGIFVASFLVFLAVALMAQILTWQWRTWLPGAEGEKSVIGGVKAAVYTAMSHLT